jgi:hypothetical protein
MNQAGFTPSTIAFIRMDYGQAKASVFAMLDVWHLFRNFSKHLF